jgi:hypothetical protein
MDDDPSSADMSMLDRRELVLLAHELDGRSRTFPFDHARLAWLESHPKTDG